MGTKKYKSRHLRDFEKFRRDWAKIQKQMESSRPLAMNVGDTVSVDHFALENVGEFIEQFMSDMEAMIRIRDIVQVTKAGGG